MMMIIIKQIQKFYIMPGKKNLFLIFSIFFSTVACYKYCQSSVSDDGDAAVVKNNNNSCLPWSWSSESMPVGPLFVTRNIANKSSNLADDESVFSIFIFDRAVTWNKQQQHRSRSSSSSILPRRIMRIIFPKHGSSNLVNTYPDTKNIFLLPVTSLRTKQDAEDGNEVFAFRFIPSNSTDTGDSIITIWFDECSDEAAWFNDTMMKSSPSSVEC
jgi:hypothetical protein